MQTTSEGNLGSSTYPWGDLYYSGYIRGLYKIVQVEVSTGTIAAGSNVAADNRALTTPSGYNAIGIVGWSSSNWRIRPTSNYVNGNSYIYAGFANDTGSSASATVTFRVLCMRATAGS